MKKKAVLMFMGFLFLSIQANAWDNQPAGMGYTKGANLSNVNESNQEGIILSQAENLFSISQYEDAIAEYEKVLVINPNNFAALFHEGECYYYLKNMEKALELLEKAESIKPETDVEKLIDIINKILQLKEKADKKPYPLTGGDARHMAMGYPEIVLPDAASIIDLYSQGFSSSLVSWPLKNIVYIPMDAYNYLNNANYYNISRTALSQNEGGGSLNGDNFDTIICWFTYDDVISILPALTFLQRAICGLLSGIARQPAGFYR